MSGYPSYNDHRHHHHHHRRAGYRDPMGYHGSHHHHHRGDYRRQRQIEKVHNRARMANATPEERLMQATMDTAN